MRSALSRFLPAALAALFLPALASAWHCHGCGQVAVLPVAPGPVATGPTFGYGAYAMAPAASYYVAPAYPAYAFTPGYSVYGYVYGGVAGVAPAPVAAPPPPGGGGPSFDPAETAKALTITMSQVTRLLDRYGAKLDDHEARLKALEAWRAKQAPAAPLGSGID